MQPSITELQVQTPQEAPETMEKICLVGQTTGHEWAQHMHQTCMELYIWVAIHKGNYHVFYLFNVLAADELPAVGATTVPAGGRSGNG